jgi:hypothetical protein
MYPPLLDASEKLNTCPVLRWALALILNLPACWSAAQERLAEIVLCEHSLVRGSVDTLYKFRLAARGPLALLIHTGGGFGLAV